MEQNQGGWGYYRFMLTATERNLLLLGSSDRFLPQRLSLNAGHLSLSFENGDLRFIRYGNREIIRRIYFALRGEGWLTVPAQISDLAIEAHSDNFSITYKAHYFHAEKGIDFTANFTLSGEPNGQVTFAFDGVAHSDFLRNRIGICVLHPAQACSNTPVTVTHPDDTKTSGVYPDTIKPDQPFFDIAALTEEVAPGVAATIRFEGEIFEMEDQRNWSDASFKTYSTPQSRPKPVEVTKDSTIHQSVTLSLIGTELSSPDFVAPSPVDVSISENSTSTFNGFGFSLPIEHFPLNDSAESALNDIRFSHLRIDVDLEGDWQNKITYALGLATTHWVPLLVGLKNAAQLTELPTLPPLRPGDAYLILSSSGAGLTSDLSSWRSLLTEGVLLLAGSNNNFTELNRNHPNLSALDGVVFAGTPQVHSFDDTSIMETPPMVAEQIRTARAFAGNKQIFTGPLTIYRPGKIKSVQQKGIIGAAWYVAAIAYAAQGSANQTTICDLSGEQGILAEDGTLFPLYNALSAVGTSTGGATQTIQISDPLQVACLAVLAEGGDWQDIFLANLQPETVSVSLSGVQGSSARIRTLDETTAGDLSAVQVAAVNEGTLSLTLLPYAVIQIISGSQIK